MRLSPSILRMRKLSHLVLLVITFLPEVLWGQAPYNLLLDLPQPYTSYSTPRDFIQKNGLIYFTASNNIYGRELFVTDGTIAGTHIFKDINPGPADASIADFQLVNTLFYFTATSLSGTSQLWVSDGTETGTYHLTQYPTTILGSAGDIVYFSIVIPNQGTEFGMSDGTEGGTHTIDLNPGTNSSYPSALGALKGKFYFWRETDGLINSLQSELWTSDGTAAGTTFVSKPGKSHSTKAMSLTDRLVFKLSDGVRDYVWVTDGTSGGTTNITPPALNFYSIKLADALDDQLAFIGYSTAIGAELYCTDGTLAGTRLVKDFYLGPGDGLSWNGNATSPVIADKTNRRFLFEANDGSGRGLWKSDGTAAGTTFVKATGFTTPLTFLNGKALLVVNSALWATDGTNAGTVRIGNSNGYAESVVEPITVVGNMAYYNNNGRLWKTDGTSSGTIEILSTQLSPYLITRYGNKIIFAGTPYGGYALGPNLMVSDGTGSNTLDIDQINLGANFNSANNLSARMGNQIFFMGAGSQLVTTDGTPGGSKVLDTGPVEENIIGGTTLTFFTKGQDGEPWKTDGTVAGTQLIKDLNPLGGSRTKFFGHIGNIGFFTANDGVHSDQIWRTDGTAAGTFSLATGTQYINISSVVMNNILYFVSDDGSHGNELWRSDGTAVGTTMVKDIIPGFGGSLPKSLTILNNNVYFVASRSGTPYYDLWRSDGTAAGTSVVVNFSQLSNSEINVFKNSLYLTVADISSHGYELWKSDGTAAGTVMVQDINPGSGSSYPQVFGSDVAGDHLFFSTLLPTRAIWVTDGTSVTKVKDFSADEELSPRGSFSGGIIFSASSFTDGTSQLWRSDGTVAGTFVISNLKTQGYAMSDGLVYYLATDESGVEIWRTDGSICGTVKLTDDNKALPALPLVPLSRHLVFLANHYDRGVSDAYYYDMDAPSPPGCKLGQTLSLTPIPPKVFGDPSFQIIATSDSGLPVAFTSSNPAVINISGSTATISSTGSTIISILQPGNATFNAASPLHVRISIGKVSLHVTAADASRLYGATDPAFTINYTGFINGDNASVLSQVPIATSNATSSSDVGNYAITPANGASPKYDLVYHPGTLTVSKAPITITADNKTGTYGAAVPTLTYTISGLQAGDQASTIDQLPSISTSATSPMTVGNYAITLQNATDNNYTISLVNGQLNVTKALLTYTSQSKAITYGDALPAFTYTVSGFVNTETEAVLDLIPSIDPTLQTTKNAGSYPISFISGNDDNYNIGYVAGTLNIAKAAVTFTAQNKTIIFGDPTPAYTYSATGFVNNETASVIDVSPSIDPTVTLITNAGVYPIPFIAGSDNNYNLNYEPGTLTITKRNQTISFPPIGPRVSGEANFILTASSSESLPVSFRADTPNATISNNRASFGEAGTAKITAFHNGNSNYNAASVSNEFCVNPPKPTLTLQNGTLISSFAGTNAWYFNDALISGKSSSVLEPSQPGVYKVKGTAASCEGEFSDNVTLVVTGLPPVKEQMPYPNPVKDFVNIFCNTAGLISTSITDISGNSLPVPLSAGTDMITLDLRALAIGVYFVKITQLNDVKVFKIVKH